MTSSRNEEYDGQFIEEFKNCGAYALTKSFINWQPTFLLKLVSSDMRHVAQLETKLYAFILDGLKFPRHFLG